VIPDAVRIFVCTEPVDMRYGFDRLVQVARERIGQDPVEGGALFVFAGRRATRMKLLWFERNGLCLLYKRLHRAVFEVPVGSENTRSIRIDGSALARLLAGSPREEKPKREKQKTESAIA
jgi:transposase